MSEKTKVGDTFDNGAITIIYLPAEEQPPWWVGKVLKCDCGTQFKLEAAAVKSLKFRVSETLASASYPCPRCETRCQTKRQ